MLQVHERLGDFEIIRLLGKGGMGEVYEARQLNPERPVALKVLAPWLARDEDA
jgi:serine/threonine protein kinase